MSQSSTININHALLNRLKLFLCCVRNKLLIIVLKIEKYGMKRACLQLFKCIPHKLKTKF